MKTLLFLLLIFPAAAFAQEDSIYVFSGNRYRYENVVKLDSSQKQDQLYEKAVQWFTMTFKDGPSSLQMQDKSDGIIIGTASYTWNTAPEKIMGVEAPATARSAYFTVKIQVKDGAYKYQFFDFNQHEFGYIKDGKITKYPVTAKIPASFVKQYHKIADDNLASLQSTTAATAGQLAATLNDAMNKPLKDSF